MLLGKDMASPVYPGWKFVDSDLYSVHRRVKEYDAECALVAHPETGEIALARWVEGAASFNSMGTWTIAMRCTNDDGSPMTGETSPRILLQQRHQDGRRIKDQGQFKARMREAEEADELAKHKARREANGEFAEEMAWNFRASHDDTIAI